MRNFPQKIYNKRNRIENVNFVFKNKYGDSLKAYTLKGRRAEIATKIACYNLWAGLNALLHELFNIAFFTKKIKNNQTERLFMAQIELYLDKSVEQNASVYFEKAKKLKKKIAGAKEAIRIHEEKLKLLEKKKAEEKEAYEEKVSSKPAKKEWYEKFRWFLTSDNLLVIGGRDATTNEIIIKKHTDTNDIVFHTDLAGSPFFVIKAEGKDVRESALREVADATLTFSRAFKLGHSNTPVFWVKPEQVTKAPNTGEYLTKGAFVIRGKTNYIDNKINLAVGKLEDGRLMAASLEAVKAHCKEYIQLEQGDSKPSEIAKKIKAKLGGNLDDTIRILPSGNMSIKK